MRLAKFRLATHSQREGDTDIYVSAKALWRSLLTGHRHSIALEWLYKQPVLGSRGVGLFIVQVSVFAGPRGAYIPLTDEFGKKPPITIRHPVPPGLVAGLRELGGEHCTVFGYGLSCPQLQDLHLALEGGLQQAVITIALRDPRVTAALT